MKFIKKALAWFFGGSFLIFGLLTLAHDPLTSIFIALIGTLLIPPINAKLVEMSRGRYSNGHRVALIAGLFFASTMLATESQKATQQAEAAKIAAQESAKREQDRLALREKLAGEKEQLLADAKLMEDASQWKDVLELTEPYLAAGDTDVTALHRRAQEKIEAAKKAAEEKARLAAERETKIKGQFSAWDGSHRKLERLIKNAMNDPKSYEHVKTWYFDRGDHLLVTTEFRGKNAFGGVVKNTVHAEVTLDGDIIKVVE